MRFCDWKRCRSYWPLGLLGGRQDVGAAEHRQDAGATKHRQDGGATKHRQDAGATKTVSLVACVGFGPVSSPGSSPMPVT